MTKRWTLQEDIYLAKFFDIVGDQCGNDPGRAKGAATARVKRVKDYGAWEPLQAFLRAEYEHLRAYYVALGRNSDVEMLDMVHVAAPEEVECE